MFWELNIVAGNGVVPNIKGVIRKRFDEYFAKCYKEYQKTTFEIINHDAKEKMDITNPTLKNGLNYLAHCGDIRYENKSRERTTRITLMEGYLQKLKLDYPEIDSAVLNVTEDDSGQGEIESVIALNMTVDSLNTMTQQKPIDKSPYNYAKDFEREGENQELRELKTKIEIFMSRIEELEIARQSQDMTINVLRDRIRTLEKIVMRAI
jgi:hypothetical protein